MGQRALKRKEIDERVELETFIAEDRSLADWVVQGVDTSGLDLSGVDVTNTLFIGCSFDSNDVRRELTSRGAQFLAVFENLPYRPYRRGLYTVEELLEGYEDGGYFDTIDFAIYAHFDRERHHECGVAIREAMAQRLHDHAIDDALEEIVGLHGGRGVVGIMGGHSTSRESKHYREVSRLAWKLTRAGYFVASGGGPGIMEAANLGAYLAPYDDLDAIDAALEILSDAPRYDGGFDHGTRDYLEAIDVYISKAKEVAEAFFGANSGEIAKTYSRTSTAPGKSLAIPTWFYGHEPTNLFGNHVAKYFSNSLREDGLLAISKAGVVFAPGSAGTLQEVFMDLAQNHYATFGARSPMVFIGQDAFSEIHDFIKGFIERREMDEVYGDLVTLVDSAEDAHAFIEASPARPLERSTPLYDLYS